MKTITIRLNFLPRLLLLVHLMATEVTNTNAQTLAPTFTPPKTGDWHIVNYGQATLSIDVDDNVTATLPFNASNRDHGALVYETDCITPLSCDNCYELNTTTPTSTKPDGYIQFDTVLKMNIWAAEEYGYFIRFVDNPALGGWIALCVETFLCYKEETIDLGNTEDPAIEATKIDFKNNLIIMTINFASVTNFTMGDDDDDDVSNNSTNTTTGGIKLGNPYENINYPNGTTDFKDIFVGFSEYIKAYECEESDLYAPVSLTYNQGDEIMICVTDESKGIVHVDQFFDLKISQPGSGISDYYFIKNTLWNPSITTAKCHDGPSSIKRKVCTAKIVALGRFFPSFDKPPDLIISGTIYLLFGGRRVRRNLQMNLPSSSYTYVEEEKKYNEFLNKYYSKVNEAVDNERRININTLGTTTTTLGMSRSRRDADLDIGGGAFDVQISLASATSSNDKSSNGGSTNASRKKMTIVASLSAAAGVIGAVAIIVFIRQKRNRSKMEQSYNYY